MFPLHPETPSEGRSLEEIFNTSTAQIATIIKDLKATADSLGLPFGDRHMTYNSRLAQELGLWAESEGCGHAFHMTLFKAYFVDGLNIGKAEILLDLAEVAGLNRVQAQEVLESRSFSDRVDADWQRSKEKKVQAVPTFMMGERAVVGAQSYQNLQQLMRDNGLSSRSGNDDLASLPVQL